MNLLDTTFLYNTVLPILLIILIVAIVLVLGRLRKNEKLKAKIIEIQNSEKLKEYKENMKNSRTNAKDYLIHLKEHSPFTIIVVAFFGWIYYLGSTQPRESVVMFFIIFGICLGVCVPLIKWIMDFKVFVGYNVEKDRYHAIVLSYRLNTKYEVVDSDNKKTLLLYPLKTKKGDAYIVDSISTKERKIIANEIHTNHKIILNFKDSFINLRKFAVGMQHTNNKLRAEMSHKVLVKSVELLNELDVIGNLIDQVGKEKIDVLKLDELENYEKKKMGIESKPKKEEEVKQ